MRPVLDPDLSPADVVARQLLEVGDRLCRQFAVDGGPTAESVREQARRTRAEYGSPTVIAYLPVLIERELRRHLAVGPPNRQEVRSNGEVQDMTEKSGRVVVGMDGSPGCRAALTFALHDAARRGAGVEVVAAFDTAETLAGLCGVPVGSIGSTERIHDDVLQETSRIVDEVTAGTADELPHPPPVTVSAVGGGAAAVLTRAGRDADLLVVGSRGRGGVASMMLGSVGLQCVLHASCPVTVVHPPVGVGPV